MIRCIFLLCVTLLLIGCMPPQMSQKESAFATVSYVQVQDQTGWFDRVRGRERFVQDLELFLDDGRIFIVPSHEDRRAYRIGDRVRIEYVHTRVVEIRYIDAVLGDGGWF